mmetsp:Transcript_2950/g.4458  ORF Transcript_2950/g.4458 Transcript_2950/m.4458 type:complete len:254 (+) Transcript_2950:188-949(+)
MWASFSASRMAHIVLFFGVIRLGRVPWSWPYALILQFEKIFAFDLFFGRVAPNTLPYVKVQPFREGFDQPIGDGLDHNLRIIIVLRLELLHLFIAAHARHSKHSNVIIHPFRPNKISHAQEAWIFLGLRVFLGLLPQHAKLAFYFHPCLIRVNSDIFVDSVGRINAHDASEVKRSAFHNRVEHNLGVVEQFLGLAPDVHIVEYFRVASVRIPPPQFPGLEEWVPIDEVQNVLDSIVVDQFVPDEVGLRWQAVP